MKGVALAAEYNRKNVKTRDLPVDHRPLYFSFANFHLAPINIEGEFNNYFSSSEQYIEKISVLLNKALPLLSKDMVTIFTTERNKAGNLHLHRVVEKRDIITEILKKYGFSQEAIDNIFEGENVYQLEIPFVNGATRIVFQRIENLISFLFIDPNHHVYFNRKKVEEAGSRFYDFCPVNAEKECMRMNDFNMCYAYEFLDRNKYAESFGCNYDPTSGGQ